MLHYVCLLPGGNGGLVGAVVEELPMAIHYIVTIAVIGFLILAVAIDMVCFCSRDWGILACICGGMSKKSQRYQGDVISLDGGPE